MASMQKTFRFKHKETDMFLVIFAQRQEVAKKMIDRAKLDSRNWTYYPEQNVRKVL